MIIVDAASFVKPPLRDLEAYRGAMKKRFANDTNKLKKIERAETLTQLRAICFGNKQKVHAVLTANRMGISPYYPRNRPKG